MTLRVRNRFQNNEVSWFDKTDKLDIYNNNNLSTCIMFRLIIIDVNSTHTHTFVFSNV